MRGLIAPAVTALLCIQAVLISLGLGLLGNSPDLDPGETFPLIPARGNQPIPEFNCFDFDEVVSSKAKNWGRMKALYR